jgi:hypothetical protein
LPGSAVQIDVLARLDQLARDNGRDTVEFENLAPFIRAKVLHKSGRHAEAWEALVPVNRSLFLAGREEFEEMTGRQRATLARVRNNQATAAPGTIGGGQTMSLFILGPSRSGKTTMERLVSTLEGVKRGYESVIVEETVRRTCQHAGLATSTWLENVPLALHQLCGEAYLEELAVRAGPARVFTNTNPHRIHDADLMAAAFPNVRLVFVKRNLEDNVLRIYMERYRLGNTYAYDLKAARDHVVWYHEMMDLLAERLPAIVRVIQYENLIADPATALGAVADLCGGVPLTNGPLPVLGDDRECSVPYRRIMGAELEG